MGSLVRSIAAGAGALVLSVAAASWAVAQSTPAAAPGPLTSPAGATFTLGFSRTDGARAFTARVYSRSLMDRSPDGIRAPREYLLGTRINGAEVWRNSRECPQIIGVLMDFERMLPAAFSLPPLFGYPPQGNNARPIAAPPPDAPGYSAWGPARQAEGSTAYLSVSAGSGPLAETIDRAEEILEPCFHD